ncbi:flagellar hook-length control protein FliK [Cereibacter ovatus]|uniref:flagellar hook-length control protein FliK n=1 Tax=Cereibacter ovatus TaxID=439529 RepID=UPI001F474B8D|nr:flagellar hook-length control protein FliK [Cereibacter ovatus]
MPDTRGADHPTFETAAEPEPSFDGAEPSGGFGAMDRPSASVDQPRRLVLAAAPAPAADPALREGVEVAQQENAALEVTLRPEELGRVTMTMAQEGDSLRVLVQAERADTLDLLRRNSDQLGAELRQAGFSGASFSFGGRDGEPPPRPRPAMENRLQPSPVSAAPSGVPQTGLDLRI